MPITPTAATTNSPEAAALSYPLFFDNPAPFLKSICLYMLPSFYNDKLYHRMNVDEAS
jgi:hypothetical protein